MSELSRREFGIDFNIPLEGDKVMIGDKITLIAAPTRDGSDSVRASTRGSASRTASRTGPGRHGPG